MSAVWPLDIPLQAESEDVASFRDCSRVSNAVTIGRRSQNCAPNGTPTSYWRCKANRKLWANLAAPCRTCQTPPCASPCSVLGGRRYARYYPFPCDKMKEKPWTVKQAGLIPDTGGACHGVGVQRSNFLRLLNGYVLRRATICSCTEASLQDPWIMHRVASIL